MLAWLTVFPRHHVHKDVLPNGLRCVTVELPHLHGATVVAYAKVGSRYESPRDNGLSHFLEHMLFRGSRRHPSSWKLNWAIERLGGTLHAETGRDYSLYQISLEPEALAEGIAILGDLMAAPRLAEIDLERQIILEELAEDFDERGRDINLDDAARAAMFPDHGLGQKITGPARNVRRFSVADVRRHLRACYGARNLVFAVSGRAKHAQVMRAARAAFGSLPSGAVVDTVAPAELPPGPHVLYIPNRGSQTSLSLLFRALPEAHPDYTALLALSRILDDGMATRLHYTLCDQLGLAYYVGAGLETFNDTALFELGATASHQKFATLVRRALALLDDLRTRRAAAGELDKAKRRYRADLTAMFDDPDGMAGWYGGTELFYAPTSLAEKLARMDAVTADDVRRVAQTVFQPSRLVAAASGGLSRPQKAAYRRAIESFH